MTMEMTQVRAITECNLNPVSMYTDHLDNTRLSLTITAPFRDSRVLLYTFWNSQALILTGLQPLSRWARKLVRASEMLPVESSRTYRRFSSNTYYTIPVAVLIVLWPL